MNEPITIAERYLSASNTSRLRLVETERTAADVLLAAGYVTMTDRDRDLVTLMWSMREKQRRFLFETAFEIACNRFLRLRKKNTRGLNGHEKSAIRRAMFWWIEQRACPDCEGRGHPTVMEPKPHLDETRECETCDGTGREPLKKLIRTEWRETAEAFLADFDIMQAEVGSEMMKKLRSDIDLSL